MGVGEKKKKGRRRREEEKEGIKPKRYGNYFEYGYNLGYDLYYESHGFCMEF